MRYLIISFLFFISCSTTHHKYIRLEKIKECSKYRDNCKVSKLCVEYYESIIDEYNLYIERLKKEDNL